MAKRHPGEINMDKTKEQVEAEVSAEFAALESAAQRQPGLTDLLNVYGGIEAAARKADEYLSILEPTPTVVTTNSTGT